MEDKKIDEKIETMEIMISNALRIGVVASAIIIALGLLAFIITGHSGYAGSTFPRSPIAILKGLIHLKPYAIMLFGLLVLILTPVFRVGVSIITFLQEKDYLYTAITATVFVILIISFFLGKVE